VNGLEIVRYARRLPHRKNTPVIMFSASDVQKAAREAGVDMYLKKPDDVKKLIEAVSSLVEIGVARLKSE
jgi:CheY-like chemotaxis protein